MEVSVKALYDSGLKYVPVSDDKAPLILNHLMLHEMREDFILNSLDHNVENILGMKEFQNLIKSIFDQQILINIDLVKEAGKLELLRVDFLDSISSDVDKLLQNNYDNVTDYTKQFYNIGKEKGFSQLQVKQFTSQADTHALFNLTQNNFSLIKNISDDVKEEIRKQVWEGVSRDESVVQIAERIKNTRIEPIEKINGRNFTIDERASMIARTESARCRNQGLINSYLQYGVEYFNSVVVKTPGTCNDCLDIEAKGPYNIKKDKDKIPPHHPNCNCHPEPAEEPNKDPKDPESFPDLVTGKNVKTNPNIHFADNEFINEYSKAVSDFQKATTNNIHEVGQIYNKNGKLMREFTNNSPEGIDFPNDLYRFGKKQGLGLNMHNHPSNVPIPSKEDIINFGITKSKYGVITSSNSYSVTTFNKPNINNIVKNIEKDYEKTFEKFMQDYMNKSDSARQILNNNLTSNNEKNRLLTENFRKYTANNPNKLNDKLNESLKIYGINIKIY
ncbi:phage Mu protein F like protein [Methanobrevibacter cuticularis]|uniref:Phage Mu protein F like protein n=1 Tax=Methanobrevibacter cuticularis TaxID=47311 RepID=A0A166CT69_9EURY|nr:phage minor head protein [Methanobrevibacter cuticularis]KZX16637.1 phage Mu protein F like protein [Methanobrevibacter cuticularis]